MNTLLLVSPPSRATFQLQLHLDEAGFRVVFEPTTRLDRLAQTLQELKPDLLLLDLLPELSVPAVMQARGNRSRVPTLLMVSRLDQRKAVHALDLGAEDCIYKPLDADELVARIHAVLRGTQARRQPAGKAAADAI